MSAVISVTDESCTPSKRRLGPQGSASAQNHIVWMTSSVGKLWVLNSGSFPLLILFLFLCFYIICHFIFVIITAMEVL